MMKMMKSLTALGLVAALAGCQSYPQTYTPVVDVQGSGKTYEQYQADLAACRQLAEQRSPYQEGAVGALGGAALGAAGGAILGAFTGKPGTGAALGAAMGGLGGAAYGGVGGVQSQEQIVSNCMRGRGYNVVGQ